MQDWIIVHSLQSYLEHPNYVGRSLKKPQWWLTEVEIGDRIVYYVTKTGYVVDAGTIFSDLYFWKTDPYWPKTWVRRFKSFFPDNKGILLDRDELKEICESARKHIGVHALGTAIRLEPGEFDHIIDACKQKGRLPRLSASSPNEFEGIANLAGLDYVVTTTHDDSLKYHKLEQVVRYLIKTGDFKGWTDLEEFLRENWGDNSNIEGMLTELRQSIERQERDVPQDSVGPVEDILGEYYPDKQHVIIYDAMCTLCAREIEVPEEDLVKVVMLHEAAHAVTHLGNDPNGLMKWNNFGYIPSDDLEMFAQAYAYHSLMQERNREALSVFETLAKHQTARYNLWRKYTDPSSINRLNMDLRSQRK